MFYQDKERNTIKMEIENWTRQSIEENYDVFEEDELTKISKNQRKDSVKDIIENWKNY